MRENTFWRSMSYYFFQGISMIISFLINYILVRKLSVADYGHASVAISLVATASVFTYQWSTTSLLYIGGNRGDGCLNEAIWSRNLILFVTVALVTVPTVVFYKALNSYLQANIIVLLYIGFIGGMLNDYVTNYFLIKKKQVLSSLMGVCTRIINLLLYIVVLNDIYTFALINAVINFVCLAFIFAVEKEDVWPPTYNRRVMASTLNFSLWQAVGIVSISATQAMSSIVIKEFATIEQVSYYNAAYKLVTAMIAFESYLPLYFVPLLVDYCKNSNMKRLQNYFYKTRLYMSVTVLLVHLTAGVLAKWIIPFLFGNEYVDSLEIFRILLVYSFVYFMILYYSSYANIMDDYKLIQLANMLSGVVIILGVIALTRVYGAYGCAVANVIGVLVKFIILFRRMERKICTHCNGQGGI